MTNAKPAGSAAVDLDERTVTLSKDGQAIVLSLGDIPAVRGLLERAWSMFNMNDDELDAHLRGQNYVRQAYTSNESGLVEVTEPCGCHDDGGGDCGDDEPITVEETIADARDRFMKRMLANAKIDDKQA